MPDAPRYHYDLVSLEHSTRVFERAYQLDSDALYAAYLADEVPDRIPLFDAHVWASMVEDIGRLRGEDPDGAPVDRVFHTFAHT